MIIFKNIEENRIRFSAEERLEDVIVRVEGLYSPSDDSAAALFSDHFETINPSIIYFISHYGFLGYPFLKLIFEKEKEDIAEILIPVNHQWSLSNYFSNSELKKINKGCLGSLQEIFLNKDYGNGNDIPNVNTIVDLGFNCGWFAAFSADKAQRYIAVEADERLNPIGLLTNKKNKNKIEICNRVFHDTNNEDITFHLNDPKHSAINSIWDKGGEGHKNEPTTKKTINLPEIIKRYNLDYIDLLKVDIEGAEEFLLKKPNLEIVLNKVGVLLIELHGEDNINAFNNNRDIKSYFDKLLLQDHGSQKIIKLTKKPTLNILKSINLPKKETNLLVLSATTKNIEFPTNKLEEAQNYGPPDWTDLTYKANKEYADIHGYDFKSVEAETKEGFHWPTWIKIPLIKKYLKDYDYVFWIDSDAIFCTNQSLEMFMGKNVGLTKCLTSKEDSKSFTITSSGAMLFKNSEFSFKVLKDLEEQAHKWADGAFLKENWHEQGFLDRLYVEPEIISTRNYESDFYNLINREAADLEKTFETENFKILPYKYHSSNVNLVDFIYHAGGDQTTKQRRLKEVYAKTKVKKISILCPTRNRPNNIQALVESARKTSSSFDDLEFIFYIDDDDTVSVEKIEELNLPNIKYIIGERIVLSKMWNKCYEKASADIFMHCGDDILFASEGWDSEVQSAFNLYNDKVVLVYGDDLAHGRNLSTHGFLHRVWVETVGYFCPPYFSCDWNDQWLFDVATAVNRKHFIPSVVTEHMHPFPGMALESKAELDSTHRERMARGEENDVKTMYYSPEMTLKREEDASKLLSRIDR